MPKKAFRAVLEVEIHELSSQYTQHLRNKEELYVTVSLFGHRKRTSLAEPYFPVPINEKFTFEKTFFAALDPKEVLDFLDNEPLSIELIQLSSAESNEENVTLGIFELNARSFFFPARMTAGPRLSQDRTLLLESLSDRLKSQVKVEYSTYSLIRETSTPYMDLMDSMFRQAHSGASSKTKKHHKEGSTSARRSRSTAASKNGDENKSAKSREQSTERQKEKDSSRRRSNSASSEDSDEYDPNRKPFVVKHVNPDMLMRVPGLHTLDRESKREHAPPMKHKNKHRYRGMLIDPERMGGIDEDGYARGETELKETFSSDDDEKFEKIKASLHSKEARSLRRQKKARERELLHDKYDRMHKRYEVDDVATDSESGSEKEAKSTYSMYKQALQIGSKTGHLKIWRDPSYSDRIHSLLKRLEENPGDLNTMEKLEIDVYRAKLRSTY